MPGVRLLLIVFFEEFFPLSSESAGFVPIDSAPIPWLLELPVAWTRIVITVVARVGVVFVVTITSVLR